MNKILVVLFFVFVCFFIAGCEYHGIQRLEQGTYKISEVSYSGTVVVGTTPDNTPRNAYDFTFYMPPPREKEIKVTNVVPLTVSIVDAKNCAYEYMHVSKGIDMRNHVYLYIHEATAVDIKERAAEEQQKIAAKAAAL